MIGQAGTGKSTMASLYATAALKRGESVALFLFEERIETFFRPVEGLGMDLRQFHADGQLIISDFNPNEISPGEFGADRAEGGERRESARRRDRQLYRLSQLAAASRQSGPATSSRCSSISRARRRARRADRRPARGLLGQNVGIDVDVELSRRHGRCCCASASAKGALRRNISVVEESGMGPTISTCASCSFRKLGGHRHPVQSAPRRRDTAVRHRDEGSLDWCWRWRRPSRGRRLASKSLLSEHGLLVRRAAAPTTFAVSWKKLPGLIVATHGEALTPRGAGDPHAHLVGQPAWSELPIVILLDRAAPQARIRAGA